MPDMIGVSAAISSKISARMREVEALRSAMPSLPAGAPGDLADDLPVGRLSPIGAIAWRTRCTRRSLLVNVPSFSAKLVAGSTTCGVCAVSCRKMSCTTRKSSLRRRLDERG